MEIIAEAQMEMNLLVPERNVKAAFQKCFSKYADNLVRIGDNALVYSEKHDK